MKKKMAARECSESKRGSNSAFNREKNSLSRISKLISQCSSSKTSRIHKSLTPSSKVNGTNSKTSRTNSLCLKTLSQTLTLRRSTTFKPSRTFQTSISELRTRIKLWMQGSVQCFQSISRLKVVNLILQGLKINFRTR